MEKPYSQIVIPVGVARTVISSSSFRDFPENDTLCAGVIRVLRHAAERGSEYRQKFGYDHADQLRALIEVLNITRENQNLTKPELAAFERFGDELLRHLERQDQVDKKNVEKEEQDRLKQEARSRANQTRFREQLMSTPIENGRSTTLKNIAKDYGLNYRDPQVRAGLIAAFHAGARQASQVASMAIASDLPQFTAEQFSTIEQRDKQTFAKARALVADQSLITFKE